MKNTPREMALIFTRPALRSCILLIAILASTVGCDDTSTSMNLDSPADVTPRDFGPMTDVTTGQRPDGAFDAGAEDANVPLDVAQSQPDMSAEPAGPWVFVSSEVLSGDSVREVNQFCRRLGSAAGLGEAWVAWVSSAARDAAEIELGDGPWYRTDGALVFQDREAIFAGPEVPINLDESQNPLSTLVFTGTNSNGENTGENCREWRSYYEEDDVTLGRTDATDSEWTAAQVTDCGRSRRVYCFQDTSTPINPQLPLVARWNELMLAAVRSTNARPTITSRRLFIVAAAMYDAWSAFDGQALPNALPVAERRPVSEHTIENQTEAVSHAAHLALVDQFPEYEDSNGRFTQLLQALGYGVDDDSQAARVGRLAATHVLEWRRSDGSNELSDFNEPASDIYPSRYVAANSPNPRLSNSLGQPDFDPNRWTPLRVPTGAAVNDSGFPVVDHSNARTYVEQTFLTAHWGAIEPFALSRADEFRPPAPPQLGQDTAYVDALEQTTTNDAAFRAQFGELLTLSASLTDEQKVAAEFWADGPRTESPPGHWNQLTHGVSTRDQNTLERDVKLYFALNAALLDAGIASWDAKRHYDFVRPATAIPHLFAGEMIRGWLGPNLGIGVMDGRDWRPYQDLTFVTPPFPEYVSGHSTFSFAAATILRLFTGSDQFHDGVSRTAEDIDGDGEDDLLGEFTLAPMSSTFDNVPAQPVTLRWPTFSDAAEQASYSRRLGGIHIQDGDLHGRAMGRQVAERAFARAQALWLGEGDSQE